ncbi:hydrogen gas-evolving membrane-bound hydrogenase subunit E [Palaeococcus ferrophilus]|uniref:hydrogen gas-evolving membrane-bound hydrogenase subunit E n=1 Tax=Palaeococcus ferrophilus TaxID=83868 RepID=UPI000698AE55|nr:hydrogen gas-evolving membrane-bound hydrogenase subunit E [Palaeococcus ferrophilus]
MRKGLALFAFVTFAIILLAVAVSLRPFGSPPHSEMDTYFIQHAQEEASANNVVTSIVFDYRGFDTLGEATVLFTAVSGVLMALRRKGVSS